MIITEINSSSDITDDWFEITNFGISPVSLTGWGFDDYPPAEANVVPLENVSTISAGESVVFLQFDDSGTPLADQIRGFRQAWGGLSGVQIGVHRGAGLGRDDGVTVFDASKALVTQQLYFNPAQPAQKHAGEWVGARPIDSAIWNPISPSGSPQFTVPVLGIHGVVAASDGGLGSPGVVVPEPNMLLGSLLVSVLAARKLRVYRRR